jgi:hypothetical protein
MDRRVQLPFWETSETRDVTRPAFFPHLMMICIITACFPFNDRHDYGGDEICLVAVALDDDHDGWCFLRFNIIFPNVYLFLLFLALEGLVGLFSLRT